MTPADFEESEYRGPLYNQLERGNHLVWEPGQVFEKHIGIDRAAFVTDPYFWGVHGVHSPLSGVVLVDYDWDYIWKARLKNKVLPDFQLNLFIQAKRSHSGRRPRGNIRKSGITGDYWKFDVTPHQQVALERMCNSLSPQALVCYAAPAFHTQSSLYEHTKNQSIVQNSSFPPATVLSGHGAWYYDQGGLFGIANPDFVRIEIEPIQMQITRVVERWSSQNSNAVESLAILAKAIVGSASNIEAPSSIDSWFQLLLARANRSAEDLAALDRRDEARIEAFRHFAQIKAFCSAYRLEWFVLGKGL